MSRNSAAMGDALPDRLLIAAISGRALAQSAQRAGCRPVVLDLFADSDTDAAAQYCERIKTDGDGFEFDAAALLEAADRHCPPGAGWDLVCGAGFETVPGLLKRLAEGRTLYGNGPETVRRMKAPDSVFSLFDDLHIPHPETRLTPPLQPAGWLQKRIGGSGGGHVVPFANDTMATAPVYWQRWIAGQAMSVLFLADGERARIVGYSRQWTARAPCETPYAFGGVMTESRPPPELSRILENAIQSLTRAAGLRGLNSLDFMRAEGQVRVLEINPRPSASFELYDSDFKSGLFIQHVRACRGELPSAPLPEIRTVRALEIVYAPSMPRERLMAPATTDWPAWCADRPIPGTSVPAGAPLCTIFAEAPTQDAVQRLLKMRRAAVLEHFEALQCAA